MLLLTYPHRNHIPSLSDRAQITTRQNHVIVANELINLFSTV